MFSVWKIVLEIVLEHQGCKFDAEIFLNNSIPILITKTYFVGFANLTVWQCKTQLWARWEMHGLMEVW